MRLYRKIGLGERMNWVEEEKISKIEEITTKDKEKCHFYCD